VTSLPRFFAASSSNREGPGKLKLGLISDFIQWHICLVSYQDSQHMAIIVVPHLISFSYKSIIQISYIVTIYQLNFVLSKFSGMRTPTNVSVNHININKLFIQRQALTGITEPWPFQTASSCLGNQRRHNRWRRHFRY
jgi:hypothetical protein